MKRAFWTAVFVIFIATALVCKLFTEEEGE